MPVPAAVPRDLSYAPFRGSDAVAGGLLTPAQLRSRQWRRLFRNIYVSSDVPLDHRIRCLAADLFLDGRGAIDVYRRPRHVIATVRAALTTPTPG